MPQLIDGKYIESIAKQMGLEFQRGTTVAQYRAYLQNGTDPDLVYLFDAGERVHTSHRELPQSYDAVLRYKGTKIALDWATTNKAAIRKFLRGECEKDECIICYEEGPLSFTGCSRCGGTICTFCSMKMCLTPPSIHFLLSGIQAPEVSVKCVQCRVGRKLDLRDLTHLVFDRLREFDEDQQKALLFLKDSDPNFEIKLKKLKKMASSNMKGTIKRFKKGCRVRTHGLKSAHWNGRIGTIIGERVVENDVIQWPVQLSGKSAKSQRKLLLKGVNMRKI